MKYFHIYLVSDNFFETVCRNFLLNLPKAQLNFFSLEIKIKNINALSNI